MSSNPFEEIDKRLESIETSLRSINQILTEIPSQTDEDELLSVQEAAEFLKLSVPTIYGKISKRQLPYLKKTRRVYFSKKDLYAYLREGRGRTAEELQAAAARY